MKSKMVSIFLCLVMVASIFAALMQYLGPLSMNVSAAGGLADSPWPMFRNNLNHTGVSPYDTSMNNGRVKWSFMTDFVIISSPAIGPDGTIYVGSCDHNLYAINPDGTEKWNVTTGDHVHSVPAIGSDGTIYVGSHDYNLYAINPDGTQKWSFTTDGQIRSSPAIDSEGTIYIGSYDDKLYAINPDGTEKWNFTTDSNVDSSPAIGSDGTIYIGSWGGKLYAIYPNGSEKWIFMTGFALNIHIDSSPAIGSDGTIYVGSDDDKLYAINPDGTEKWNFITGGDIGSSPAIGSDGTIYVGSGDDKLYAINPDGTEKWNFITGRDVYSSPAIGSDGTIYFGSRGNNLYAINPNGSKKWSFTTGDGIMSSPAIDSDGTIYIGSHDHKLHAIGSLEVEVTSHFTTLNSAAQSLITVQVRRGTNPIQGASVNLTTNNGGFLSLQSGTTDINGNFISIFNAPTVTTQIICRITAQANKTGYGSDSGYVDVAIIPIPWPMFRHNLNHTGLSPYDTSGNNGKLKWNFNPGDDIYSSPAIGSDGTIYVGSNNFNLYAINPDGTVKWNFTTDSSIYFASPAISSDGTIYVGSSDYKLYAINPDGTEKWSFMTGHYVWSSPAIGSDGTIYVGSCDNNLYAINPDGTEKWRFTTGNNIMSSPAIGPDGTIYIGSDDNKLYAMNPDGTEEWSFTTGNIIFSSPAIGSDGTIYVGSWDKNLYAINPDGTEKWNFTTGSNVESSPAIGPDGTIYVGSWDGKLYAIYPDGSEKWIFMTSFLIGPPIDSSPAIGSDGTIFVGSNDGKLYAINPDGTEKWNFTTPDRVWSSPAIGSDGTIYVGSGGNELYAIGTPLNQPPVSDAGPDQTVNEGDVVQFNDSGSYDPDGTIVSYEWDFNASDGLWWETGAPPDAIGPNPTYTYDENGVFIATLRVTDNNGSMDTDTCELIVLVPPLPPLLNINVSLDGDDVILYWDPPSTPGIDHYLIYRSTSQTDFDFSNVWVNTSINNESGEPGPIPLRTMWNDTKAALPGDSNYEQQYYYIIRAVNILGQVSYTSRTVGKWSKTFPQGVSTFSLPLEPLGNLDTEWYTSNMNAEYIKYMNTTTHTWMQHNFGDGTKNNMQMKLGEGYEVKFNSQINYTFTGMPAAMIRHRTGGFIGFDYNTDAKNLSAILDHVTGNVTLTWDQPLGMDGDDSYKVYRSITRDGFDDGTAVLLDTLPFGNETYVYPGAASFLGQYYYMIIPVNETGFRGSSTYSIGIWTEEYLSSYDTLGIPLKLESYQTADWYCDNIPDTVGINYFNNSQERWSWHSTRMSEGAFDPLLEMVYGYQISTSSATKFTFIGV